MTQPVSLQRLTTQYVAEEDRLRSVQGSQQLIARTPAIGTPVQALH